MYGGENKWTPSRTSVGIPRVSTRFSLSVKMSRLTRDGTAEPVLHYQTLGREGGQGNIHFPCSLNTSKTGNHASLIDIMVYVMIIHTFTTDAVTCTLDARLLSGYVRIVAATFRGPRLPPRHGSVCVHLSQLRALRQSSRTAR